MDIKITLTEHKKDKPKAGTKLGFGKVFTDHMFLMNYSPEKGWFNPRIEPFHPLELYPSCMVFHYAQEMFEGLKAYKGKDNSVYLFRPEMNAKRAYNSCLRLCIPPVKEEDFIEAIKTLVKVDEDWIPTEDGTSLYIRPFIIATDEFLGVHPSKTYLFVIILSPSGSYYPDGLKPVNIWVEDEYVRAVRGGMGAAKTGGNYACSLIGQQKASRENYSQVLWLDGVERKYIEEVGAMNIFFKIEGKIVTPLLSDSILPGITRDSIIQLCKYLKYPVEERRISIDELVEKQKEGKLEEVFGTGTAAVISPVGKLRYKEDVFTIGDGGIGQVSQSLYDHLTGIQKGDLNDPFGWREKID
jgi:branched-chain amino acid aminotransferase